MRTTCNGLVSACLLTVRLHVHSQLSAAHIAGIQTACNGRFTRPFDDGAAIGEESDLVGIVPEFQHKAIMANIAMRLKASADLRKVDWPVPLMNLHGVPAAERNVRPALSRKMDKVTLATTPASGSWR